MPISAVAGLKGNTSWRRTPRQIVASSSAVSTVGGREAM
jgi:hypothetical protein